MLLAHPTYGNKRVTKSGLFATKTAGTSVNPADLMTKPLLERKIEQLMNLMGNEFMKIGSDVLRVDRREHE